LRRHEEERLEIKEVTEKNLIEAEKFSEIIKAIGPKTLVEISRAGPELQQKLLQGLNLQGYIVTDGNNPINLFRVADSNYLIINI
jgi:major vault protein